MFRIKFQRFLDWVRLGETKNERQMRTCDENYRKTENYLKCEMFERSKLGQLI